MELLILGFSDIEHCDTMDCRIMHQTRLVFLLTLSLFILSCSISWQEIPVQGFPAADQDLRGHYVNYVMNVVLNKIRKAPICSHIHPCEIILAAAKALILIFAGNLLCP